MTIVAGNGTKAVAVSRRKTILFLALICAMASQIGVLLGGLELGLWGKGCGPAAPPVATVGASTAPTGALDVPVIPQRNGTLLINVPDSRMDQAIVHSQQDANDLWRILYGAPYPAGPA